jgi:hypothetical protein
MLFAPSRSGGFLRDNLALCGGKALRTSFAALHSAFAFGGWMPLGFAHGIFGFANGNVENLLRELDGITRTFGHEASIAQAAPWFYRVKIQTDTLPEACPERSRRVEESLSRKRKHQPSKTFPPRNFPEPTIVYSTRAERGLPCSHSYSGACFS